MKKFLQSMLLIALFAVPFATQAQSILEEDFESSSTGTLPTGWTKMKGGSSVGVSTSYTCSGSHSFKFEGASGSDPVSMVAISGLTVEANTTEMTFSTRNESTYSQCGSFSVGYVTDLTDPNTFVAIETHNASEFNGSCQEFTVAFSSAPAGAYIAFRQTPDGTSYNYYWFIDDIDIHELPTCPKPIGLTFSNLTATSADIAWTAGGEESEWELTISPAIEGESVFTTYANTYSFTDLSSNTVYRVSCRAVCSSGDSSLAATSSFRTECGEMEIPYICNFDDETAGSTPSCWYPVSGVSITTTSSRVHSAPKSLYFEGYGATIVSPRIPMPINEVMVSFFLQKEGESSGSMQVGYLTSLDGQPTYVATIEQSVSSTYEEFEVSFGELEITDTCYIVFHQNNSSNWYYWIDDLTIGTIPTCIRPNDFRTTSVKGTQVDLAWHERGEASSWLITYKPYSDLSDENLEEVIADDTVYTLTNLTPKTKYIATLASLCDDGDTSVAASIIFNTVCGDTLCDMVITCDGDYSYDWEYSYLQIWQGDWLAGEVSGYDEDTYTSISGPQIISICPDSVKLVADPDYYYTMYYNPVFTVVSPTGQVLFDEQEIGEYESGQIIYNDYMGCPDCVHPSNVQLLASGAESVTLAWTAATGTSAWGYEYGVQGFTLGQGTAGDATETSVTLEGLTPSTAYDFYVYTDCGDGYSDTVRFTFRTDCLPISQFPWTENFSGMTADQLPTSCWDNSGSTTSTVSDPTNFYYVWGVYNYDGNKMLRMNNWFVQSGLAIMNTPSLVIPEESAIELRFKYSNRTSSGNLVVKAVRADGTTVDLASFGNTSTDYDYTNPGVFEDAEVSLQAFAGQTIKIQFYNMANYGSGAIFVDDVTVSAPATCPRVASVTFDSASTSEIFLHWVPADETTAWVVEYGLNGFVPGTGTIVPASDTNIIIDNLLASSAYDIYVSTDCGTETSEGRMITARTACSDVMLPFAENFDSYTTSEQPSCWTPLNGTSDHCTITNSYSVSPNNCFRFGGYLATIATPRIATPINQVTMSFKLRMESSSESGTIQVGYTPDLDSTPVYVANIQPTTTGQWGLYEVSFADVTSMENCYIVFHQNQTSSTSNYWYWMDDVSIEKISSCPTPCNVVCSNRTNNSATITWSDTSNSHINTTLYWGTANNFAFANDSAVATSNTYTINGLQGSTTYYVWVKGNCTAEPSRTATTSFTTYADCGIVNDLDAQYSSLTNRIVISWQPNTNGNPRTGFMVEYKKNNETDWTSGQTNDFYFNINNVDTFATYTIRVYQLCGNDSSEYAEISLTTTACNVVGTGISNTAYTPIMMDGDYSYYSGYVYDYSQLIYLRNEVLTLGDTLYGIYFNMNNAPTSNSMKNRKIQLFIGNTTMDQFGDNGEYVPMSELTMVYDSTWTLHDGWCYIPFTTAFVRDNTKNLVVAMRDTTGSSHYNQYTFKSYSTDTYRAANFVSTEIFDVADSLNLQEVAELRVNGINQVRFNTTCREITCFAPVVTIGTRTQNSIELTWLAGMDETSWSVEYAPYGDTTWTMSIANTTATSHIVTGLMAGSRYQFRVTSLCGGDDLSRAIVNAYTECGPQTVPYYNDFNNLIVGNFTHPCWSVSGTYIQTLRTAGTTSMLNIYQGYAILPEMTADLDTLQVRFKAAIEYTGSSYYLVVGYCPTQDISTFVPVDTINNVSTTGQSYVVRFGHLTGMDGFITFYNPTYGEFYLDDIEVNYMDPCPEVMATHFDSATVNTATVGWTPFGANATSYIVEYGPMGFELGTGSIATTDSTHITFTGLTPSSTYDYYVYAICANTGDTSVASVRSQFNTDCYPMNVTINTPFFEGFESEDAPAVCWSLAYADASVPEGNLMIHSSDQAYSGDQSFRFSSYSSASNYNEYLITPELNISGNGAVSFYYKKSNSSTETFRVGYSTTGNDTNDFVWTNRYEATQDWAQFTDSIGDSIKYIAINYWGSFAWYLFIDDFTVTSDGSACSAPVVNVTDKTYESVNISWVAENDSCEVAITNGVWSSTLPATTVTTGSYSFTNLTPATTYNIGVRQLCEEGVYSDWTVVEVTTDSLPCFAPEAFTFVSATYHTATLSWTAVGEETMWNVRIFNTTYDSTYTATAANATFGGLQAGVAYNAQVRAMCGTNGQIEGDWCADTLSFTTADCAPVANLTATAAGTDAIQLSWTNGGAEQAWVIEYADDPDFGQGEGTAVNVSSNPATVTGLEPNTEYFFYVYAQCEEALRSVASSRANATTHNVGINDVNGATSIAIYPNPAQNATTISVSGVEGKVSISIVDLNGRAVFNDNMECEGDCVKTLDVEGLAQGAYFVRIYGENVNSVKKLIVR